MTLADLNPNEKGVITSLEIEGTLKRRLIDMGVTSGTEVTMIRRAPFRDPIQFRILGYYLTLRKNDAAKIKIEGLEAS